MLNPVTALKNPVQVSIVVGMTLGVCWSNPGVSHATEVGFNRRSHNPNNTFYQKINQFQQFINTEKNSLDASQIGARTLDLNKLHLNFDSKVSVYFINEGAGYRNQLGLQTTGGTVINSKILFKDVTCTSADCKNPRHFNPQKPFGLADKQPLQIGDYFHLGKIKAGTKLDFFLRQDGYNKPSAQQFYAQRDRNKDQLQHLIAYDYQDILVLAWEDRANGGDLDYNDLVFAVDIGKKNIDQIPTLVVPEQLAPVVGNIGQQTIDIIPAATPRPFMPPRENPAQQTVVIGTAVTPEPFTPRREALGQQKIAILPTLTPVAVAAINPSLEGQDTPANPPEPATVPLVVPAPLTPTTNNQEQPTVELTPSPTTELSPPVTEDFSKSLPPEITVPKPSPSGAAVPEPSTLIGVLIATGFGWLFKKHR